MKKFLASLPLCLVVGLAGTAFGQTAGDMHDEIKQTEKAARILGEVMSAPDKAIPRKILGNADCVAVFPSVVKAAFGIGGHGGKGVVVCRNASGWSAPAFLKLGGGSFGLQIGVESTDYVMLFMTPESARSLLSNNFKLGGSMSVAAGPVGRDAGAATDVAMNSQILSYSRSKGLFAGASLEGAVVETDNDDMEDVYGENATARDVLFGSVKAPPQVTGLAKALQSYAPAPVSTSGTR